MTRWARTVSVAMLAVFTFTGCALVPPPNPQPRPNITVTPPPLPSYVIQTTFIESDFAPYAGRGSANLRGEAYVQLSGGRVLMAADREVVLVPDTAYTRELLAPAQSGRYSHVANFDPRYFQYRRTTTTDGSGAFAFLGIPPGAYIVQTSVTDPATGRTTFLHRRIAVRGGTGTNVVMTNPV